MYGLFESPENSRSCFLDFAIKETFPVLSVHKQFSNCRVIGGVRITEEVANIDQIGQMVML